MRTTLAIDVALLERAKRRAAERGMTLDEYVGAAIQRDLAATEPVSRPIELPVFASGKSRPGIDVTSNRDLFNAFDDQGSST